MEQYNVTGMSCAACSARVEKAVRAVYGVDECNVSLLTNTMAVNGNASPEKIISAVVAAGYGATKKGVQAKENDELKDTETPILRKRLITSVVFLVLLMYVSMGHMMWGFPILSFFENNYIGIGLLELLLTIIIMVINKKFFVSGIKGLIHKAPNMDTLVALGAGASFVYSTYILFAMTTASQEHLMHYAHEFYFESAGMILTLITLGKMLEAMSKGRTTDALKSLMRLKSDTAVVIRNGEEVEINIDEVVKGDIFIVKPGERIPVDGIVTEGESAVDESALSGESMPVDKAKGDKVNAATLNSSGFLKCEAMRVGEDTTISKIIKMVSDAAATKAPIAKVADKVSGIFVPCVISIAIITLAVWLAVGESVGFSLARAISVLVISCPCALGLATPVAIMVGNGVGAKNKILFKTAAALEEMGRIRNIALDKTGTITMGEPHVTDILTADSVSSEQLIKYALSLEVKSEHPLAKAVIKYAEENAILPLETTLFKAVAGNGLSCEVGNKKLLGGNREFIEKECHISGDIAKKALSCAEEGKTPLFFCLDKKLLGAICVADIIKPDSAKAIGELRDMGIKVVMITGDNERTANAIGKEAGVSEVIASVLPEGKKDAVGKIKLTGKTAMVGDGINDAPALTEADVGVAIGAGTDVAIDAADVVLMNSSLCDVSAAVRLGRKTLKNIHENLFWAFIYNVIGIPLAAGVWIRLFGLQLNPMFGAAAMSLSSFCVVTNALRLNFFDIRDTKHIKKHKVEELNIMEKTIKVDGMMCAHCEARVKQALEEVHGVVSAAPDHTTGNVKIVLDNDVKEEKLYKAVEAAGYKRA